MNLTQAHAAIALMADAGRNLDRYGIAAEQPAAPLLGAALASCSGWLADASTEEQLLEALEHGWQLFESGIITEQQWGASVGDVARDLEVLAEQAATIAEQN